MKKLRPLGNITDDMEELLYELMDEHGLQFHEVIGIVYAWTQVHYPSAFEVYEDGSSPILTYGPKKE